MNQLAFILLSISAWYTNAERASPYCGACQMLITELQLGIAAEDPKKTVKVGSFRVDPNGNQKLSERPYAGSEGHVHELLEKACSAADKWTLATLTTSSHGVYVRLEDYDGRRRSYNPSDATFDDDKHHRTAIQKKLTLACENILDDYEEDIAELITKPDRHHIRFFCSQIKDYCTDMDLTEVPFRYLDHDTTADLTNEEIGDDLSKNDDALLNDNVLEGGRASDDL